MPVLASLRPPGEAQPMQDFVGKQLCMWCGLNGAFPWEDAVGEEGWGEKGNLGREMG